ncbi:MAG: hypothetical protein ACK5YS_05490 [bacterium]
MLRGFVVKFLFLSALLWATAVAGQISQRTEIGGGLGILNYTGDLVSTFDLATSKPAATLFYR